jgi:periplasmic copper chaperone A
MIRRVLTTASLAFATFGLAACGGQEQTPAETSPDAPEGIAASNGRLMLPAVSGNPGVAYFDVENSGTENRMIRAVSVTGAGRTEMHRMGGTEEEPAMEEVYQVRVNAGETVNFQPGGLHVMAFDLDEGLASGGSTEVTVTFVGGDKVSLPAEVRAAGDER